MRDAIATHPGSERDTVLVTFLDPRRPPRLFLPRDPGKRHAMLDSVRAARNTRYAPLLAELQARYGVTVLRSFPLVPALLITVRLDRVDSLASRPEVIRIEPLHGGPPPGALCGRKTDTVLTALEKMHADGFRAGGFGTGRIALLDTGIDGAHALLSGNAHIGQRYNCTADGVCTPSATQEDVDPTGHGTATAAILVGSDSLGEENAGMLDATLDSYRVYEETGGNAELILPAAVSAIYDCIDRGYDLIVAEMAVPEAEYGGISEAAGQAYDAGIIVVAANGNGGDPSIRAPAGATRVIGVGAYCIADGEFVRDWVHGSTADGRVKPDLTAPTSVYTATKGGSKALLGFGGTSGATPFAGGAALMLRDWMRGSGREPDPGAVYAMLALFGRAGDVDSEQGAGPLELPTDGAVWWDSVTVKQDAVLDVPLDLSGTSAEHLDAALWWADPSEENEDGSSTRSDVDLYLIAPQGSIAASSLTSTSVFERATAGVTSSTRTAGWTLRIHGAAMPDGPRTVYWAAWARPAE